ncbi:MAG: histidine kinase [Verrucomicrobia bacterium]|nr:histidine kinase [Verrucomicrobiota bacterium]
MKKKTRKLKPDLGLRKQALDRIKRDTPASERRRELHELQVHKVELEIQNEELRSSRAEVEAGLARYTDLYDFAPVGYFTLRGDGLISQVNLTGARLLGMERSRLNGRPFGAFVAENERSKFQEMLLGVFAAQSGPATHVIVTRREAPHITLQIDATISGDGTKCNAVVTDITARAHAESEILRLNRDLEELVRRRTATIRKLAVAVTLAEKRERVRLSHVLHENLQQLIVGAVFLLQSVESKSPAAERKTLRKVKAILVSAGQLARSLAVELSPPVLRTGGLVGVLRWLARWMRENHGLTVKVTDHVKQDRLAEEKSFLLFQLVRELLFNVIKHAEVKSAVVTLEQVDGFLLVTVSDQGVGFAAPKEHALPSTTGKLGLFSVSERLALVDGEFLIDSSVGQGSRFTLRVPHPTDQPAEAPKRKNKTPTPFAGV